MASFPAAVKSFASRTNGQTIDAAHIQDLQDEVNAIEDGYVNGTAPLHASSATVTGGLTLNGKPYTFPSSGGSTGQVLTIVSTSGSTMGLEWREPAATAPTAARVNLGDIAQTANGSTTPLSWKHQDFATNSSLHSTGTNPQRLTPQSTGIYRFELECAVTSASSQVDAWIEDSSGTKIAYVYRRQDIAKDFAFACSGLKRFDVTGSYVVAVMRPLGSTNQLSTASENFFSIEKL